MSLRFLVAGAVLVALSGAAAAQGSCRYEEGMTAYRSGKAAEAIAAWLPCAQDGDAEVQYLIAMAYLSAGEVGNAKAWLEIAIAEGRLWSPPAPWLDAAIGALNALQ